MLPSGLAFIFIAYYLEVEMAKCMYLICKQFQPSTREMNLLQAQQGKRLFACGMVLQIGDLN